MTTQISKPERLNRPVRAVRIRRRAMQVFGGYFWLVFKNAIGWILIISSLPVGLTLPGPGGIPLFLIGFALVTFPGKRQLTSRVMRGRGLPIEAQLFSTATTIFSILITCAFMWFVSGRYERLLERFHIHPEGADATLAGKLVGLSGVAIITLLITYLVARLGLEIFNFILRGMPLLRRRMRPWMRKHGLILLPSRHNQNDNGQSNGQEILQLHARHTDRLKVAGEMLLRWAKRAAAAAITVGIFVWMLKPIKSQWPIVRERIYQTSFTRLGLAICLFAAFLFMFRALVWRRIVNSFGHHLPIAPATRIWSTSELARYLPGVIWQVVGRVYLVRPYGVSPGICSITQILELAIFMVANVIVALACLLYFGIKNLQGLPRNCLFGAACLLPLLLLMLHTKIFYGIINRILIRMGKPPIVQRLRGYVLVGMIAWNVIGLLWQSIAIFLVVQQPLGLIWDWWWIVAGAYCLAWLAGFVAFWAPGGIGVREWTFVSAMSVILPQSLQHDHEALNALLVLLAVLLRLWSIGGELLLATFAYAFDLRGAFNRPDAPGRVRAPTE